MALTEAQRQAFGESLDLLLTAAGVLVEESERPGARLSFKTCVQLIIKTSWKVEDAFCRLDWRAYRDWAYQISVRDGIKWEPCHEWFNGRRGRWTPDTLPASTKKP